MGLIRKRLFLLDTFGLIFRAFYGRARAAVSGLRTSAGLPTEAIYVFNNMLKKLLDEHEPDYVVAVWEGHGPTFREEIYPEYKANRDEMPEDLAAQLPYIQRLLGAWNVTVLAEDGYEADDTIGLLTGQASGLDVEVWIVSSDKDLMQLVGDGVVMLNPARNQEFREADVEAYLGVRPSRVTDMLALRGDPVDNIPGAPGIGPKGAKQLIEAYGDIEGILDHAEEVRRKNYRESLQNNAEEIRLSKRLATLDTRGSLRLELERVQSTEPDQDRLLALYQELEFKSLASQLEGAMSQPAPTARVEVFESAGQLEEWLQGSGAPVSVALLGPSDLNSGGSDAEGLGLCAEAGEAWRVPPGTCAAGEGPARVLRQGHLRARLEVCDPCVPPAGDPVPRSGRRHDAHGVPGRLQPHRLHAAQDRRAQARQSMEAGRCGRRRPHPDLARAAPQGDRLSEPARSLRDDRAPARSRAGPHGGCRSPAGALSPGRCSP